MSPIFPPYLANPNATVNAGYQIDEQTRRKLERYRHLNFVRRILNPELYPSVQRDWRLDPGQSASHQMGWTTIESGPLKGKHIVYPNVVQTGNGRDLMWPTPRDAVRYAIRTGEYIPFDSPEQADMFSQKYKRGSAGMQAGR